MFRNTFQLQRAHGDPEFRTGFAVSFSLRTFLEECILPPDYRPPTGIEQAIALTPSGVEWKEKLNSAFRDLTPSETALTIFVKFFHHELLVDVKTFDAGRIKRFLHDEILADRIRFPWVYRRMLYDRFFDLFPTTTSELSYADTVKLLAGTPKGVFQLGSIVVGPFGVTESRETRYLSPTRSVPLWHCSDIACSALHAGYLATADTRISAAYTWLFEECRKAWGPESEWDGFYRSVSVRARYYDDNNLAGLPWLLANAYSERELKAILAHAIDSGPKDIRSNFPSEQSAGGFVGDGQQIAARLSVPHCLQLLLLFPDSALVNSIESLIDSGIIVIPPTEVRGLGPRIDQGTWWDLTAQCSNFGVRFVPRSGSNSLLRARKVIKAIYFPSGEQDDLMWKLRATPGGNLEEKLNGYLHRTDPRKMIHDLVLDSAKHLSTAITTLEYGRFPTPSTQQEEDRLVTRILWKLGFTIRGYPTTQTTFWERLGKFAGTGAKYGSSSDPGMEIIRSAGVNFFVSLEEVLDSALSFFTWVLISDHFARTRFRWNLEMSRKFMAEQLREVETGDGQKIPIDPHGKNTLFVLTQGFRALANLCNKIIAATAEFKRQPDGFPGFLHATDLVPFPFHHTALILDLSQEETQRTIALLESITRDLSESGVMSIRNRIDHNRPDFPRSDEIERCCKTVETLMLRMEDTGIVPLVYLNSGMAEDEFGRLRVVMRNYKGREMVFELPSQIRTLGLPGPIVPQVIVPSIHFGKVPEMFRCRTEEESEYTKLWADYPKRRSRLPEEEERIVETEVSSTV